MEIIPHEKLETTMEIDASESGSSICLRTPLILRQIMQNFTNKELLTTLSFVSKLWNYEARRLLSYRGRLIAILKHCQELEAFASDVRQMNFIPFSGVGISINNFEHPATCQPSATGELNPIHHELCHHLPWKTLYLNVCGKWELSRNCPAFLLITTALRDFSMTIERMSITLDSPRAQFVLQFLQNLEFPSLKKLTILECHDYENYEEHTGFFKAFVSRAPKLEEIHPDTGIMGLKGDLLEGSSAVVCVRSPNPLYFDLCEGILSALRLEDMDLTPLSDDPIVKKFDRVIPKVLQTSRFALTSLSIDSVFLVRFMRYGIYLENLGYLRINTWHENLGPFQMRVWNLLKTFDFTRIFPKLIRVSLDHINHSHSSTLSCAQISDFIEQGCDALQEPMLDRAVNIKSLFSNWALKDLETSFLSAMFPSIETLYVLPGNLSKVNYEQIWKRWIHLKDLEVRAYFKEHGQDDTQVVNLDSAFCGIFPEEVAELREKDDEYLKAVHIVPVAPSITCVKDIRTVTFLIRGKYDESIKELFAEIDLLSTIVFSKVTGLLAFARCPNLSVTLKTNSYQVERELSHMKRYAQVVLDRSQWLRHLEPMTGLAVHFHGNFSENSTS